MEIAGDDRYLKEVTGAHKAGRNNDDVKWLWIDNYPHLEHIPRNIYQFFPNLQALLIVRTGIAKVSGEDFRGLSKLVQFEFNNAKITSVGNDWFKETPNLQFICIQGHPLRHIGSRVFDHLTSLNTLHVNLNTCIDVFVNHNRPAVLQLFSRFANECPPSAETASDDIFEGAIFEDKVDALIARQIEPLVRKLQATERKVESLEGRVSTLENL